MLNPDKPGRLAESLVVVDPQPLVSAASGHPGNHPKHSFAPVNLKYGGLDPLRIVCQLRQNPTGQLQGQGPSGLPKQRPDGEYLIITQGSEARRRLLYEVRFKLISLLFGTNMPAKAAEGPLKMVAGLSRVGGRQLSDPIETFENSGILVSTPSSGYGIIHAGSPGPAFERHPAGQEFIPPNKNGPPPIVLVERPFQAVSHNRRTKKAVLRGDSQHEWRRATKIQFVASRH